MYPISILISNNTKCVSTYSYRTDTIQGYNTCGNFEVGNRSLPRWLLYSKKSTFLGNSKYAHDAHKHHTPNTPDDHKLVMRNSALKTRRTGAMFFGLSLVPRFFHPLVVSLGRRSGKALHGNTNSGKTVMLPMNTAYCIQLIPNAFLWLSTVLCVSTSSSSSLRVH